jgi:hypothetical protein
MRRHVAPSIVWATAACMAFLGTPAALAASSLSVDGNGMSAIDGDGKPSGRSTPPWGTRSSSAVA